MMRREVMPCRVRGAYHVCDKNEKNERLPHEICANIKSYLAVHSPVIRSLACLLCGHGHVEVMTIQRLPLRVSSMIILDNSSPQVVSTVAQCCMPMLHVLDHDCLFSGS